MKAFPVEPFTHHKGEMAKEASSRALGTDDALALKPASAAALRPASAPCLRQAESAQVPEAEPAATRALPVSGGRKAAFPSSHTGFSPRWQARCTTGLQPPAMATKSQAIELMPVAARHLDAADGLRPLHVGDDAALDDRGAA